MAQNVNCKKCGNGFQITDEDLKFYDKVSPLVAEKKLLMLPPKLCPACRHQRRLSFRNERNLYNAKCALCKKAVVTIYSPDKGFTIYCRDCWWSDKWDPFAYGKDFDFNRPFFDQYKELLKVVPRAAIISYNCENCDYTNYQNDSRNCYLTFGSGVMEDCMYCNWCYHAKNSVDCSYCSKSQIDYMNVDCYETYNCRYCQDCKLVSDCSFCFDCRGCKNCFGCVGLRQKEYFIFNKSYSKEEYEKMVADLSKPENKLKVEEEVRKLKLAHPHLAARLTKSENCDGDDIENSKNCKECYGVKDCFDCKYCFDVVGGAGFGARDVYDAERTGDNELTYEVCSGGYYKFSHFIYGSSHLNFTQYAIECNSCNYIFGCLAIRNKKYVILNKQYTKEQYEELLPKIVGHLNKTSEWGEFFPSTLSAFGYNETLANEYFPLTKEQALKAGFAWSDYEQPMPNVAKAYKSSQLPLDPKSVNDQILEYPIYCEQSKKFYKIVKQELEFYRKNGISLPKKHPNLRYKERLALQNPRQLFERNCAKCSVKISTVYAPGRPEIIYCEKCYLEAIY